MLIVSDDTVRARIKNTEYSAITDSGVSVCAITMLNGTVVVGAGNSQSDAFNMAFAKAHEFETYLFREKESASNGPEEGSRFGIGEAVALLKTGKKVSRSSWNADGMYLLWVEEASWNVSPSLAMLANDATMGRYGFFAMRTADLKLVPWLCSQNDLAATDYFLVD